MREELDRLRSLGANFFEPHIIQYMPYPYLWNDWVALTTTVVVLFAFRGHGLVLDILTPTFAFVGWMVITHAFSCYIRIVPGRLDILRVPLFRSGDFHLVKTVSLRRKSIVCHFGTRKLILRPREVAETPSTCDPEYGTADSVDFDLRRVATPHAFVAFVIQGAMCQVEAPVG